MKHLFLAAAAVVALPLCAPAYAQTMTPPAATDQMTPAQPADQTTTPPASTDTMTPPTDTSTSSTPPAADGAMTTQTAPAAPMATDTAPMPAQTTSAPMTNDGGDPVGGYQPNGQALSGALQPGQTATFQPAQSPDQAYPAPAPLASYPTCKAGQYDNCMQASGSRRSARRRR